MAVLVIGGVGGLVGDALFNVDMVDWLFEVAVSLERTDDAWLVAFLLAGLGALFVGTIAGGLIGRWLRITRILKHGTVVPAAVSRVLTDDSVCQR